MRVETDKITRKRKWPRSEPKGHDSPRPSNKYNVLIEPVVTEPPALGARTRKLSLVLEIAPNERWMVGNKIPIQAFDAFNLPQDFETFVDHSRSKFAAQSKMRIGQVTYNLIIFSLSYNFPLLIIIVVQTLSDFSQIVNGNEEDVDGPSMEKLHIELDGPPRSQLLMQN